MFRIRTAFATLALFVGFGSACNAQMHNVGVGLGFGQTGFSGGFGGFQPGFGGIQLGVVAGVDPLLGSGFPHGYSYGYGYGAPYYAPYGYYAPVPQTYNAMGSLIDSIESSTSRRGGWRRWP